MAAKNASRETVLKRRVWLIVRKTLQSLNMKQGKLVPGVWIIFCRQRRGHEKI